MKKIHGLIEKNIFLMTLGVFITVIIGGIIEIVPLFTIETTIEKVSGMRPYSPLELAGRNIYLREGCYNCHSQQIRTSRDEVARYGHYSLAAESLYDHPFQWGSKRTGPDLARLGGRYSDEWNVRHLVSPRSVVSASIMPNYPHLLSTPLEYKDIQDHLKAMNIVGIKDKDGNPPYSEEMIANAVKHLELQASEDWQEILSFYHKAKGGYLDGNPGTLTEMDALIAYLQMLGTLVDFTKFDTHDSLKQ